MDRQSPYAFACQRCRRCCRDKIIQVNPYEVARLAGRLGLSTSGFLRQYTGKGGAHLTFDADNVCPFLTQAGCGVHPDRPLVCRLYPLGRHVAFNGDEWFTEAEADPGCEGRRTAETTVLAYVEGQGALPFMRAADLYLALYWKLSSLLEAAEAPGDPLDGSGESWADLDAAVARFCAEQRIPVPASIEDRMLLHIQAIVSWAHVPG